MKLSFVLNLLNPNNMGPIKYQLNAAGEVLKCLPKEKHWLGGGYRSAAVAARLLLDGKIVALPTDTIYGLACLAQSNEAIQSLYNIKKRDLNKPLAIWYGISYIILFIL
jgi:hydrogenase maturation factor HypF (carbamoyltransferase family)